MLQARYRSSFGCDSGGDFGPGTPDIEDWKEEMKNVDVTTNYFFQPFFKILILMILLSTFSALCKDLNGGITGSDRVLVNVSEILPFSKETGKQVARAKANTGAVSGDTKIN